jgi:hypothetical protein
MTMVNREAGGRRVDRVQRRSVIAALATLLMAPERSAGQQPQSKIPRVGVFSPADNETTPEIEAFRKGLRELQPAARGQEARGR